jgi:hypothetical protein
VERRRSSLYSSTLGTSNSVFGNQFFEPKTVGFSRYIQPAAEFKVTIVLSNTWARLTVSSPPLVARCYERLWHAGDEAAVPESCCRQSSHSVALAGRSSKVMPRSGNTCAGSEPPSLTILRDTRMHVRGPAGVRADAILRHPRGRLSGSSTCRAAATLGSCRALPLRGRANSRAIGAGRPRWARLLVEIQCPIAARHSRLMWVLADVVGLFSIKVVPFSPNVGRDHRIFSANLGPKRWMLSGQAVYVIGPLHLVMYARSSFPASEPIEIAFRDTSSKPWPNRPIGKS